MSNKAKLLLLLPLLQLRALEPHLQQHAGRHQPPLRREGVALDMRQCRVLLQRALAVQAVHFPRPAGGPGWGKKLLILLSHPLMRLEAPSGPNSDTRFPPSAAPSSYMSLSDSLLVGC